jgi:hypothetical protein
MKILRAWHLFALICGLAVVFGWVVAESQPFNTCVTTEYSAIANKTADKSAEKITATFKIYSGCVGGFLESTEGEGLITSFATILIAVFTFTLYVATTEQGRLTRESIDESKLSSQRQLRAYVAASPLKAFIADGQFGVVVQLKNTGVTPAFETRCLWQLDVGAKPRKGDFDYGFANPNDDPIPTFVLYPNSEHTSARTHAISEAELANIENGTDIIRAFGIVFYIDAFGNDQTGKFYCYMDKLGYKMWMANFMAQPTDNRKPIAAPFKFTEGNNCASFS